MRPLASNLNIPTGDTRANLVTVKVGTGGRVNFFNQAGGGGRTAVLHEESLYTRQSLGYDTPQRRLSRTTGAALGTHRSLVAPAFDGDLGFFVVPATPGGPMTLSAIDQRTGALVWSTAGDGQLVTAPVVIDGKVILGSSTGRVTAWDQRTGIEVWSASAGAALKLPVEHNSFQTAALAVADGLLLVPAGGRLVAFGGGGG